MKSRIILVFNQEEAVRESLQLMLSEEGFLCFTVEGDDEALKVLSTEPVSLAILDNSTLDTTQLLQMIKQTNPFVKIIITSSYSEFDKTQQALTIGADDFILEPLDFDELLAKIQKLLLPVPG
jgi:DNA-binding response OmpR family regulator